MTAPMQLTLDGDTRIIVTRQFSAPPAQVLRAHIEPALIRRWMIGPDGWTMPICDCDPRPGGSFCFGWTNGTDSSFHATGEYLEVTPERIVHIERIFLPDPTPDNHVDTRFTPDGTGTRMTMVMTLPSLDARTAVIASGMPDGLEDSYARLETILAKA